MKPNSRLFVEAKQRQLFQQPPLADEPLRADFRRSATVPIVLDPMFWSVAWFLGTILKKWIACLLFSLDRLRKG